MVIVDQHAAHERLVYERMKEGMAAGGVARQALLMPAGGRARRPRPSASLPRAPSWPTSAWCWSRSAPARCLVRETPALLGETDVAGLVRDIADDLAENGAALALKGG